MADAVHSKQKLLQDLIAPDVRETKVPLEALEKRMDAQFESMRKETLAQVNAVHGEVTLLRSAMEANFRSVLAAISELKSHNEALSLREIAFRRERVAVLESHRAPQ